MFSTSGSGIAIGWAVGPEQDIDIDVGGVSHANLERVWGTGDAGVPVLIEDRALLAVRASEGRASRALDADEEIGDDRRCRPIDACDGVWYSRGEVCFLR